MFLVSLITPCRLFLSLSFTRSHSLSLIWILLAWSVFPPFLFTKIDWNRYRVHNSFMGLSMVNTKMRARHAVSAAFILCFEWLCNDQRSTSALWNIAFHSPAREKWEVDIKKERFVVMKRLTSTKQQQPPHNNNSKQTVNKWEMTQTQNQKVHREPAHRPFSVSELKCTLEIVYADKHQVYEVWWCVWHWHMRVSQQYDNNHGFSFFYFTGVAEYFMCM